MKKSQAIIYMHLVALLWGFSGVLGAMTTLDSSIITCVRSIFALFSLLLLYGFKNIKELLYKESKSFPVLILVGLLLGIHWILFFRSIQAGGVAIALVTYAAGPTIIALAEVALGLRAPRALTFIAALLTFVGVSAMHPISNWAAFLSAGFVYGMLSSITVACMALIVKKLLNQKIPAIVVSVSQLFGAILVSLPFALYHYSSHSIQIGYMDWFILILLGVGCTAIGQTLFTHALSHVAVSSATIIASMEAPYGVILAYLLLGQPFNLGIMFGVCAVTAAAILISFEKEAL